MDLKSIAASIPDYQHFLFVDEQHTSTQILKAEYPDLTSIRVVGETRNKKPIPLLSIHHGDGLPNAFLFGAPVWQLPSNGEIPEAS